MKIIGFIEQEETFLYLPNQKASSHQSVNGRETGYRMEGGGHAPAPVISSTAGGT